MNNFQWIGGGAKSSAANTGVPGWNLNPSIWVDPINGNDGYSGTDISLPLKSLTEYFRRLGNQPISGQLTPGGVFIQLLNSFPLDFIGFDISVNFAQFGQLIIAGQKTVLNTYTVSAAAPFSATAIGVYALTGAPNLTNLGYVGKFIRISDSANPSNIGLKTQIADANPTNPIGSFNGNFADQSSFDVGEPAVGDEVQVYDVTAIPGPLNVSCYGMGTLIFLDCDVGIPGQDHSVIINSGNVDFIACLVRGTDWYEGVSFGNIAACGVFETRSYGFLSCWASVFNSIGGTALSARASGFINLNTQCLFQACGLSAGHFLEGPGNVIISAGEPQYFNKYTAPAVGITANSSVVTDAQLYAINAVSAPSAYNIMNGGKLMYATGLKPATAGVAPTSPFVLGGVNVASGSVPLMNAFGATVAVNI